MARSDTRTVWPTGIRRVLRAAGSDGSTDWELVAEVGVVKAYKWDTWFYGPELCGGWHFDLTHLDQAPHLAFICGSFPPGIYADWLQENSIKLPTEVYELLRGLSDGVPIGTQS